MPRGKNKKRCYHCNKLFDKKDINVYGRCPKCQKYFYRTNKESCKYLRKVDNYHGG